jgi:YVTN family beta-propeller protein
VRLGSALAVLALPCLALSIGACVATDAPKPAAKAVVYISAEEGGEVAVIDPEAGVVTDRIPVGKRPRGLRLSRDGKSLFVALSGSPIGGPGVDESSLPPPDRAADGIGLVDLATRKLVRTFPSGDDPESFDLSPDGRSVYISNEDAGEMSVLDVESGEVRGHVKVGWEPEGVSVRPDGRVVYVTCEADNLVAVVDTQTLEVVGRIEVAARPRSVTFTADGQTAFVTGETAGAVVVVDAQAHKPLATIPVEGRPGAELPPRPMGSVLSPDGAHVYVSNGRNRSVAVIDVQGRRVVRLIEDVGVRPWGIGTSPDGRKLYTANGPSNDVSVVDVASGRVDRRIAVGGKPWGIAVSLRP